MSSVSIRRGIGHTVPKLRRYIESDRLQPTLQDIHDLDLIQLKRVLKDNWINHHRIVKLMAVLMQLDVAWAALIIGNAHERSQKRIFIERYGDYAQLWEPSNNAIRRSKTLFEATLALLLERYPETRLPISFIFENAFFAMASHEIRRQILLALIRLFWVIHSYERLPSRDDLGQLYVNRLKKMLKTNFKTHHRLSRLLSALQQLDLAWIAQGVRNPVEVEIRRVSIRGYDHTSLFEPIGDLLRETKRAYGIIAEELVKRYPETSIPMVMNSD